MRWLKALVIGMGILIVIGFVVMIIGIGQKFSKSGPGSNPDWEAIPPSSQIIDWVTVDDKLILVLQNPNKEIIFLTLHNKHLKPGEILSTPFHLNQRSIDND